jgi:hypothetical protein
MQEFNLWDSFLNFLKNPIKSIISIFEGVPGITLDYAYASKIKDYNRIYVSRFDDKSITGVIEQPVIDLNPVMIMNFTGFTANICDAVSNYAETHPATGYPIYGATNCTRVEDSYYLISDQKEVLDVWPDFSSKLRLS